MPKISIIIPVYNAEKFIRRCIDSILAQSFQDFELILVNDGSTDSSKEICDSYSSLDNRIIVISQENSGASSARNAGLEFAKSEYVCFIDADDYVGKEYLSCMVDKTDKQADLICQGLTCIKNGSESVIGFDKEEVFAIDNDCSFFDKYILFRFCGSYCKLFKRCLIQENSIKFSSKIICAEDFDFILKYLRCCNYIKVTPSANYYYEHHENSVSTRIYKFNEEYSGLCQLYKSTNDIIKLKNNESFCKQKRSLITYYIQRVIFSNYKNNYAHKERINNLKSIDNIFYTYLEKYHTPETKFLGLVKFLFVHKQYLALDFVMSIATKC